MAALESKVTELKRDVSSSSTRINEAEGRIHHAEETLGKTEATLDSINKRIAYLESKTDDLENRGRRKNLRLFGSREGAEGQQTLLNFVNDMLTRWLELTPVRALTLERVHRTLASGKPNQHRAVRFLKFQEKEFVYRESRRRDITHDGGKISFAQDFSAETVRIRRGFYTVRKLFVDINAFRGFQHNPCKLRVLHNGKIHLFTTPQQAEELYKSIQQ
ncbi:LINE-1 retrotransposable element ORF1 protein [Dissostichus eleginoides]|uniref:LINE-1 retrotransposable element ORF1 protein n=1 Tax=Dissostichus eleginoides TaxID=100907 RepID=A0AAD9B3D7_DISEL|nr:LINE-1 retrotransposable element ORF1 protein [Dissostichus eleginoides]